jgi:CheY-like chemotaxis protein
MRAVSGSGLRPVAGAAETDHRADPTASRGLAASRPMEILFVEDSPTYARLTMGALENGRIPHRMNWLQDGADALDFLLRRGRFADAPRPDLVLLDLGLPGLSGQDVLAAIRGDAALRTLPVVVMTASQSLDDRLDCELLEVEGYLTKPVDLPKFLRLVWQLREFWRDDMLLPTSA